MRRFWLRRFQDETGCSGEGVVAEGIEFTDGRVAMRWLPGIAGKSFTNIGDCIEDVNLVHGHQGKTVVEFVDMQPAVPQSESEVILVPREKRRSNRSKKRSVPVSPGSTALVVVATASR